MSSTFVLVEAEEMTLTNYRVETGKGHASGGGNISLRNLGLSGSATWEFSGVTGLYDIELGYFDESDGVSQLEILVDGVSLATLTLDAQLGADIDSAATAAVSQVASGITLNPGQTITIVGTGNAGERARVDYLKFISLNGETTDTINNNVGEETTGTATANTIQIEAEEMTLTNYRVETGKGHASGGGNISLRNLGLSGSATWEFSGVTGLYDIELGYFDESDGVSQLEILVDGVSLATLTLDAQLGADIDSAATTAVNKVASGITLNPGQTITIVGTGNAGERARVDYLKFIPLDGETTDTMNNNVGEETTGTATANTIQIEAEEMTLTNYRVETGKGHASGGGNISLRNLGLSGSATWEFSGVTGLYDIELGYFDESDGVSQLEILVDGVSLATLTLDAQLGADIDSAATAAVSKVASGITLNPGQTITIVGTGNAGEKARVDYLKFIPAGETTSVDVDAEVDLESDAVSYKDATGGIIARLDEDFAYISATTTPLKIMPLGDSITQGVMGTRIRDGGGYRLFLEQQLTADGFALDFVGSRTHGSTGLNDPDHQGQPGWRISEINNNVEQWLSNSLPDVVLLTIGTNDTFRNGVSSETIVGELSELIDTITNYSPDTQLLISSLPPIHPYVRPAEQVTLGNAISEAIPNLVSSKQAEDKKISFVDFSSLTLDDLTSSIKLDLDNGLHPNAAGYEKIASIWREAIYSETGQKDILLDVADIEGSVFADSIFGDELGNELSGNLGDDYLVGNSGSDTLIGGGGTDSLKGGTEADFFVFESYLDESDIIEDFTVASDKIVISAGGFGGGLIADTAVTEAQFTIGTIALDELDRFIYDSTSGNLFFDVDGNGQQAQSLIVNLATNVVISELDLSIIA